MPRDRRKTVWARPYSGLRPADPELSLKSELTFESSESQSCVVASEAERVV
jgi:hypothetical protein